MYYDYTNIVHSCATPMTSSFMLYFKIFWDLFFLLCFSMYSACVQTLLSKMLSTTLLLWSVIAGKLSNPFCSWRHPAGFTLMLGLMHGCIPGLVYSMILELLCPPSVLNPRSYVFCFHDPLSWRYTSSGNLLKRYLWKINLKVENPVSIFTLDHVGGERTVDW